MSNNLITWKKKYGSVYAITIENYLIYYRTLTAWELQSVLDLKKSNKTELDIDAAIVSLGVLSSTPSFSRPGSVTSLAQEIWSKSSLTEDSISSTKEVVREWAKEAVTTNFNIALSTLLCKVLPSIDLVNLLSMPTSKLMRIAALVESITDINILDSGSSSSKVQLPVKEGYNVSQAQVQQVTSALDKALNKLKK